jgi:hypothetical protein
MVTLACIFYSKLFLFTPQDSNVRFRFLSRQGAIFFVDLLALLFPRPLSLTSNHPHYVRANNILIYRPFDNEKIW